MTEAAAIRLGDDQLEHLADLIAQRTGALLHIPATWLREQARQGRVPHRRLGKYVRFDATELTAWADGHTVGPRPRAHRKAAA